MSYSNSPGCVNCEASHKRCDRTRGPTGCRRCAKAGIECGGYLASRIPKPKHSIRENETSTSIITEAITRQAYFSSLTNQPIPTEHTNPISGVVTSFTDPSAPIDASRSVENNSAIPNDLLPSNDPDPDPNHTPLYTTQHFQTRLESAIHEKVPFPPAKTDHAIPGGRITPLIEPMPTPPVEEQIGIGTHRPPIIELMTPGSADSKSDQAANSLVAPLTPENHHAEPEVGFGSASSTTNRVESMANWLAYPDEDLQSDDPENIRGELLDGLVLDRQVESNLLPFIVHSFASWMSRFLFEPVRIIGITRDHIMRGYANHPTQQTMMLISNAALSVSRSTNYDLTDFMTLHTQLLKSTVEVRARINVELSREQALSAMEHSHEFISTLCRVGSFASVLNVMDLYSPIFRRACPEPSEALVNLPRVLTTINIHLQFYATLDVLQSVLTHRPMFFRYDLDFLSPRDEELVNAEDGPGLRWLYGVPDRLMITLAKMNTLLEDFGCCVDAGRVRELEKEIRAFAPVIGSSAGTDPILNIGRVMVQESWRLAAYVYLYMGLCGADSSDARVTNAQQKFMRLLDHIRPRRSPDSFLVLPIVIIGMATSTPIEQSTLLARLSGVAECVKPGTMGNNLMNMLSDVWTRTERRAAVWSDLRLACLQVTGL